MTSLRRLLRPLPLAILIIFLAACGGGSEPGQPSVNPPPDAAQNIGELANSPGSDDPATIVALEAVEESAGESVEADQAAVDDAIVLAAAELESSARSEPQWNYNAENHFTVLTTAQGTSSSPDGIEVTEVFWYGCPHCYNFEPYLNNWKKGLADDVNFVRMPVMWNPTNEIHARLFYTIKALGKLDEVHDAVFKAIHLNRKTLTTEASIREFLIGFDISGEEFDSTFRSFAVESSLKRAKKLTQRYRIQSVPLLVTNGKYLTEGPEVKTFEQMLAVTDELVEKERQAL
jgi:thiol:disulfide interchange protein DsbA